MPPRLHKRARLPLHTRARSRLKRLSSEYRAPIQRIFLHLASNPHTANAACHPGGGSAAVSPEIQVSDRTIAAEFMHLPARIPGCLFVNRTESPE